MAKASFAKNTFYTLVRMIVGIVISLVTTILIARLLGPEGQGLYSLIILLPSMLLTFMNLGIGVSTAYYVGKDEVDLHTVYKTNILSNIILTILSIIIGVIFVLFFREQFLGGAPVLLLLLALSNVPFLLLNQSLQGIFQGKQDFESFNVTLIIGHIIKLIAVIFLLVVFNLGLNGAIYSYVISNIIVYVLTIYLLNKKHGARYKLGTFSTELFKKTIVYGLKSHLSNIATFLNYRAALLLLAFFINPIAVGIYVAAVNVAERLWVVSQAISSVLFPKITSLTEDDSRNKITSILSRNILFLSIIFGLALFVLSDPVITILYGQKYEEAGLVLMLLIPGIILGSNSKVLSNDIAGRGMPEINMYISILNLVINVVLNIILIPKYGLSGSAIATTIAYGFDFFAKIFMFKRITHLSYREFLFITKEDLQLYMKYLMKMTKKINVKTN
nr:flippase [Fredinandcohnia onubensis]